MRKFLRWTIEFVLREEEGQASLLVLNFLIPMFLAFGLMTRVDDSVVMKLRLQNATDAAALEVGSLTARVMNQVSLHNNTILKYHSLIAALDAAIDGADRAQQLAQQELRDAQSQLQCWRDVDGEVDRALQACDIGTGITCTDLPTFGTRGNDADLEVLVKRVTTGCIAFLSGTEIPNWNTTLNFWNDELQWLRQKRQSVENEIGGLARDLAQKSRDMVDQLDEEAQRLCDDLELKHRIDELFIPDQPGQNLLAGGSLNHGAFLELKDLSQTGYEAVSMGGLDDTNQIVDDPKLVMGFKHFEGTPGQFGRDYTSAGTIADRDGGTKQQPGQWNQGNGNWGPAPYYLEFIKNVHFGLPGYFNFRELHGPLGNADTDRPDCGAPQQQHPGCDTDHGQGPQPCPTERLTNPTQYCQLGQCNEDQDTYTRDQALQDMDSALEGKNQEQFSRTEVGQLVQLMDSPKLEFIVTGRIDPNHFPRLEGGTFRLYRRFFALSFPANTLKPTAVDGGGNVTNPDRGTGGATFQAERYNALSKFRLYNLSESEGEILEPNDFDQYPQKMLTQDWNALLVPIQWGQALDGNGDGLTQYGRDAMRH